MGSIPFSRELRSKCYSLSKQYNKTGREMRRNFYKKLIDRLTSIPQSNPKVFWDTINSLKMNEKKSDNLHIEANEWLNHLRKLNMVDTNKNKIEKEFKRTLDLLEIPNNKKILDAPISLKEISKACHKLKNNKSNDMDCIRNEMLKYGQQVLLPSIGKLFNLILQSGTYPLAWSTGYLIHIHKSGDITDSNNYRGILITSCLSQLYNSVLNKRLEDFISQNKVLSDNRI